MGKRVRLVRNAERALALRKQDAASAPVLGEEATTPHAFLQEMWDLFGDGRSIASSSARTMLMMDALEEHTRAGAVVLRPTVGTAHLLAELVRRFSGTEPFDGFVMRFAAEDDADADLPEGQREALSVIARYRSFLDEHALIEENSAASELLETGALFEAQADEPLFADPALDGWLASGAKPMTEEARISALPEGVRSRFIFAAGATAVVRAVKEALDHAIEDGAAHGEETSVVVFARDPRGMRAALAPYLASIKAKSTCRARIPFIQTDLGSALLAARGLLRGDEGWRIFATDLAYSPLSGMRAFDAERLNTELRKDSLMTCDEARSRLSEVSPSFERIAEVAQSCSVEAVQRLKEAFGKEGEEAVRLDVASERALAALEKAACDASSLGITFDVLDVLESGSIVCAEEDAVRNDVRATVSFCGMEAMDALAPASVDAVIFSDMTKGSFSVPHARPSTDGILDRMGIVDERDRYAELRAAFTVAQKAARMSVTCICPMRDHAGSQLYPSFIMDEFVEASSAGSACAVDAEGVFKVPAGSEESVVMLDEEDVVQGFGQAFAHPLETIELPRRVCGELDHLQMRDFMRMSEVKPGSPVLSASQIEAYAQCPYSWFIARKVGVQSMDEAFDGLQRGTFAHEVFKRTFDALAEEGVRRVDEENLAHVKDVAMGVFDALAEEQAKLVPGNRSIAVSERDVAALERVRRDILSSLSHMIGLPEGFSVWEGELALRPEDGIECAGAVVNGSVDRVDATEDGKFVVLDYKGSIYDHGAGVDEQGLQALPSKIQALIYAQALRKTPRFSDMTCVGALYLSYKAHTSKGLLAGSVDPLSYDVAGLSDGRRSWVRMDFQGFLDRVEELIVPLVQGMLDGRIHPDPRPGACQRCAMTFCDARAM